MTYLKELRDELATNIQAIEEISQSNLGNNWKGLVIAIIQAKNWEIDEMINRLYRTRNIGRPWSKEDLKVLKDALSESADPTCYEELTHIEEMLCERLGREWSPIKRKAIEHGFGRKVDYWIYKSCEPQVGD